MRYWLTPPNLYKKLDNEFNFDFDPPFGRDYDSHRIDYDDDCVVKPVAAVHDASSSLLLRIAVASDTCE